jgi:hypothetical protein
MNRFCAKLKKHFPDQPSLDPYNYPTSWKRIEDEVQLEEWNEAEGRRNPIDLLQVPELNHAPWWLDWNRIKFQQFLNKYYPGSSFHSDTYPVIGYGGDCEGVDTNYSMVTISSENPIIRIIIFEWTHCDEMAIEELGWSKEFVSGHLKHYHFGKWAPHDLVFLEHEWGSSKFGNKIPGMAFPSDIGMRLMNLID